MLRSRTFGLGIAIALVACGGGAASPRPPPPPPSPPDAPALAASLADGVGPRLAGSPGDAAAVAWALRTAKELGLSAVHAEPVTVPVWRRIVEEATLEGAPLAVAALGGSTSTPADGVTAPVVRVTSLDEVTSASPDAYRDRLVFFDVPIVRARDGSGYGAGAKIRVLGPAAAAAKGALAVLVRSVGTANDDAPHTGVTKEPEPPASAVAAVALGATSADRLARAILAGPTRITLRVRTERGADATSANVLAEARGRDPSARGIVLVGAHLDSWDLGRGAADDGCGVGAVLDAAARIGRAGGARRTVRVVLFASEENSGAGAKAYAAAHGTEPHASATEMDAGCGAAYEVRVLAGEEGETAATRAALARAIAPLPLADATAEGGADVQPLRGLGVPIVDVRQDMSAYFDVHHSQLDVAAAIDADGLRQAAATLLAVVRTLADAPGADPLTSVPEAKRKRSY